MGENKYFWLVFKILVIVVVLYFFGEFGMFFILYFLEWEKLVKIR